MNDYIDSVRERRHDMLVSEAAEFLRNFGDAEGDLLKGCEGMQKMIDAAYGRDAETLGVDAYEDWAEIWAYELEAFSLVMGGMRKLFYG